MLQLQARQVEGSHAAEQLHVAALRVASVARVHQHIFKNQSAGSVNAKGYIENLMPELQGTLNGSSPILVDVQPASRAADLLVPLGLVLSELVINATKHGDGQIAVCFEEPSPGVHRLTVANAGNRLSSDFSPSKTSGLGTKVIVALARQLGGALEFGTQENGSGAKFSIDFPALKNNVHYVPSCSFAACFNLGLMRLIVQLLRRCNSRTRIGRAPDRLLLSSRRVRA
ncbi:MAG TPA: sensor histidine kinase [Devosia sp.]